MSGYNEFNQAIWSIYKKENIMFTTQQSGSFSNQTILGVGQGGGKYGYLVGGYVRVDTAGTLLSAVTLTFTWDDGTGNATQQITTALNVAGVKTQIPPFTAVLDSTNSDVYLTVSGTVVSTGATFTVFATFVQA